MNPEPHTRVGLLFDEGRLFGGGFQETHFEGSPIVRQTHVRVFL